MITRDECLRGADKCFQTMADIKARVEKLDEDFLAVHGEVFMATAHAVAAQATAYATMAIALGQ